MTNQMEFSIFTLLFNASYGVQFIIFILFSFSLISWKIIIESLFVVTAVEFEFTSFNKLLCGFKETSPTPINKIYEDNKEKRKNGIYKIFITSFKFVNENSCLLNHKKERKKDENNELYLISLYNDIFLEELSLAEQNLKKNLSTLGTISSSSPYIGLLGTVYGILVAFWGIGVDAQSSISTIAPSIAEALIATGMGLVVAIPALIMFNKLNSKIDCLIDKYERVLGVSKILLKKNIINKDIGRKKQIHNKKDC